MISYLKLKEFPRDLGWTINKCGGKYLMKNKDKFVP